MTPTERRAALVWRLCRGERFTTEQAARLLGISERYAARYLRVISRVTGIYYDDPLDDRPRWQRV